MFRAKDVYGMDSFMLKPLKESLALPIRRVINSPVFSSVYPTTLKAAIVTPIFKAGNPKDICNYRPISILPIISKVIEKWISEQLIYHLNNSPLSLHLKQFGFISNHSTETANCYFTEKVKEPFYKGGVVGLVFLDLKKAFDTLNHKALVSVLSEFYFSQNVLELIKSYATDRTQHVKINGQLSSAGHPPTGVPQGSIRVPLLFSLYINELPSVCESIEIQMCADDEVIYVHNKNKNKVASKLSNAIILVAK